MASIKRKLSLKLNGNTFLYKILERVNLILFHSDRKERLIHPGNNDKDKIYYVIRSNGENEGLLSIYLHCVRSALIAKRNGYIPYIDYSDETCQYKVDYKVDGSDNVFEYYFSQPHHININDKANVVLSGWGGGVI